MSRRDEPPPFSWSLVDGEDAGDEPPQRPSVPGDETLTVPQVAARVKQMLERGFPAPVWVVGEASGLSRGRRGASGHWYFSLVDDTCDDPRRRASLSVMLWRSDVARLFGPRGRLRAFQPEDGVVLRVRVHPEFYAPRGSLGFIIEDIDPDFTLGKLDRQRRELLARLDADGTLLRNKRVPLPDVPLRIGLITSVESAACHDVLETFAESGLGLELLLCDARMQGDETSRTVRAALLTLAARRPDCIVIARGGGSRLDLACFDREDIARAIAACPVPVLTGIGHEIDTSIADAVAHASFKTPTAAAQFVAERVHTGRRETDAAFAEIASRAQSVLERGHEELLRGSARVRSAAGARMSTGTLELRATSQALRGAVERALSSAQVLLLDTRSRLGRGRHMERLAALESRLGAEREQLGTRALALLERERATLIAAADRARLLDPRQVLSRGFAWLRRQDGSSLKEARAARPAEELMAVLRDGELAVRVSDVHGTSRPAPS